MDVARDFMHMLASRVLSLYKKGRHKNGGLSGNCVNGTPANYDLHLTFTHRKQIMSTLTAAAALWLISGLLTLILSRGMWLYIAGHIFVDWTAVAITIPLWPIPLFRYIQPYAMPAEKAASIIIYGLGVFSLILAFS